MENKPNVFAAASMTDAMKQANETGDLIAKQANEELNITNVNKSKGEIDAEIKMQKETLEKLEEQIRIRDEFLAKKRAEASGETVVDTITEAPKITYSEPDNKPLNKSSKSEEEKYAILSRPQEDVPYDSIILPSEGLIYKNCGKRLDVAYLNASDENIITNPNLLKSGKFLEVLLNRKILNPNIRYKDLHVGDRNAIMIWLRSTGFGPKYNIKLNDPNDDYKEFQVEIDLSKLGIKYLTVPPDENGHFTFKLPISGVEITFRLLTVGDIDDIEDYINRMSEELGPEFTDGSTYTLKKQIIAINGDYNKDVLNTFIENKMRLGDVRALRSYINKIESGVDMNLTVETPGGESLATFLPLNFSFFWPDYEL